MSNHAFTREQLLQYISKLENLEKEKSNISEDIKEVFADAKNNGFDVKAMKHVIKLRKIDKAKLEEEDALIELYRDAVGV